MTMPNYTMEQKAKAFDTLWKTCGKGLPTDFCWKSGGDGDNGEHLMYELDIYFECLDAGEKA